MVKHSVIVSRNVNQSQLLLSNICYSILSAANIHVFFKKCLQHKILQLTDAINSGCQTV